MTITIVTAVDNNGGIGKDGRLPWYVPAELAHFHRTVANMTTVCGVNTYPTLPKALRERTLVWSGRGWGDNPTVNTDEVLSLAMMQNVAIIGGARTYAEFLPYADKIMLSHVFGEYEVDTLFPTAEIDGNLVPAYDDLSGWRWAGDDLRREINEEWAWFELVRRVQP